MKSSRTISTAEREHVARVKGLPCVVCGHPGPSEAHHVKQESHFYTVALCTDCHRGHRNGWHGQRCMWNLRKMDELDALVETYRRLAYG